MEKFSKKKWVKFASDTVKKDDRISDMPDFKAFGELMETIFRSGYAAVPPSPIVESDRMWVRVWLAMKGYKVYSTVVKNAEASSIVSHFHKLM